MAVILQFPDARAQREQRLRGEIYIYPHHDEGGSWCVVHASSWGHFEAIISRGHFSYDQAVTAAKQAAAVYRAELKI
jgi:hypothetical protein